MTYAPVNSTNVISLEIAFLPTGDAIPSSDLDEANTVLATVIEAVRLFLHDPTFDVWKSLNWVFVSYHWIILHNVGQIAPTSYKGAASGTGFVGIGTPNFTAPIQYPPSNNIFYNETLFTIYSDYFTDILVPLLAKLGRTYTLPPFLPINDQNRLQAVLASFVTSYSCTQRQMKGWLNVVISVLVADYALVIGAYSFVIFVGGQSGRFKNSSRLSESETSPPAGGDVTDSETVTSQTRWKEIADDVRLLEDSVDSK
jgi:hypothetical protein